MEKETERWGILWRWDMDGFFFFFYDENKDKVVWVESGAGGRKSNER